MIETHNPNDKETTILLAIPGLKESIQEADKQISNGEVFTLAETFEEVIV